MKPMYIEEFLMSLKQIDITFYRFIYKKVENNTSGIEGTKHNMIAYIKKLTGFTGVSYAEFYNF